MDVNEWVNDCMFQCSNSDIICNRCDNIYTCNNLIDDDNIKFDN